MNQLPPWVRALHIEITHFDEWKRHAPAEESLLFWCLKTARVDTGKYFVWAKDHYGLAKVAEAYFKLEPDRKLWDKIANVANWSPWMLPLDMWQDVVFIGCVEPPVETQWSFPVAYILCEPADLEKRWVALKGAPFKAPGTAPAPAAPPPPVEEFTRSLFNTTTTLQAPTATPPSMPVAPSAPPPIPDALEIEGAMPIGLSLNLPPSKETSTGLGSFPEIQANQINDEAAPPAGFSLNALPPPLNMSSAAEPPLEVTSSRPMPAEPEVPVGMTGEHPIEMTKTAAFVPFQLPSPAGVMNLAGAPVRIEDAKTQDACIAWCFRQLKSRFQTAVLFLKSDNGLESWKWDLGLRPITDPPQPVSLSEPSLFRVVARTLRPYHGHVVDTPAHSRFFQSWGYPGLPKHVTAVPLVVNGSFRGLLLAIGDNGDSYPDTLSFCEITADRLVTRFEAVKSPFEQKPAA